MHDIQIIPLPVSAINLADTGFKISRANEGQISALAASMAGIGMSVPPLVSPKDETYVVVSGFKRLEAVVSLGWDSVPCRVAEGLLDKDLAGLAVAENAFQRELGPGEQIRALGLLGRFMDAGQISKNALTLFNTRYNAGFIKRLIKIQDLPDSALDLLDQGRLCIKAAISLTGFTPKEAATFLDLFASVKLSSSKQMEIITWVREICTRESLLISGLINEMADPEEQEHKDLAAKGNLLRSRLYARRYPALDQAKKEAASRVQALKLPKGVRMSLPENFESMVYSLSLAFTDPEIFQDQVQALGKLSGAEDFNALLKR